MMDRVGKAKDIKDLLDYDKELTMFVITNLRLLKMGRQVHMVINMKRKIQTELLTTYHPTILLLLTSYATTFFKPIYFEASLTVNLTIMLVMTTIFTSKMQELPPTSDTKMIDIWLVYCLLVPFAFIVVQTAIEWYRDESTLMKDGGSESSGTSIFVVTSENDVLEEGKERINTKEPGGQMENHDSVLRQLCWAGWLKLFRNFKPCFLQNLLFFPFSHFSLPSAIYPLQLAFTPRSFK